MRQIKHFTSCKWTLDPGNPFGLHHVQRHHLWLLAAFQDSNATQNACEFTLFFKSTPLSLKLKKTLSWPRAKFSWFVTLFCSGSGPNCSTAVMFLEMDVSWCVSSGNTCLRGNLVNFWLVDHKIWPCHSSWYMLCTMCIHNSQVGTLVIEPYDVQTSKSVIFDMIQIFFKQSDTLKLLILSNKQSLSSSWIFIFPSTGSALELSKVSTLSYIRTPSYQTKHGKRRRDFFVATLAKRRSPAYHRKTSGLC